MQRNGSKKAAWVKEAALIIGAFVLFILKTRILGSCGNQPVNPHYDYDDEGPWPLGTAEYQDGILSA